MNRSALNTSLLGSSNALPWISAVASQALRLAGTISVGLTKYGSAAGSLVLGSSLKATRHIACRASTITVALVGYLPMRVWTNVKAVVSQILRVVIGSGGHKITHAVADGALTLDGAAIPRPLIAVHVSGDIPLTLTTHIIASDLATGPAPDERVTGIVDFKTQTTGAVIIGGA